MVIFYFGKTVELTLARVYLLVLLMSFISGAAAAVSYRAGMVILILGIIGSYILLDRAVKRVGEAAVRVFNKKIILKDKFVSRDKISYIVRVRSPLQRIFGCCSLYIVTCEGKNLIADISLSDSRTLRRVLSD